MCSVITWLSNCRKDLNILLINFILTNFFITSNLMLQLLELSVSFNCKRISSKFISHHRDYHLKQVLPAVLTSITFVIPPSSCVIKTIPRGVKWAGFRSHKRDFFVSPTPTRHVKRKVHIFQHYISFWLMRSASVSKLDQHYSCIKGLCGWFY